MLRIKAFGLNDGLWPLIAFFLFLATCALMPLAKNQVRKKHPGYIVITLGHPSKQSNSLGPLCISNNGLYLAFISLNRKFSKTCSLIYFLLGRAKMVSDLKIYMRNKPLTLLAFFSKKHYIFIKIIYESGLMKHNDLKCIK